MPLAETCTLFELSSEFGARMRCGSVAMTACGTNGTIGKPVRRQSSHGSVLRKLAMYFSVMISCNGLLTDVNAGLAARYAVIAADDTPSFVMLALMASRYGWSAAAAPLTINRASASVNF